MILVYHLICGIITLFAVTQVQDGSAFIKQMRKECNGSSPAGETKVESMVRWGMYLAFGSAAWIVLWPLIIVSWAIARIVKPEPQEENSDTEEN